MANIGVYFTDQKKILVASRASVLPNLLSGNEIIQESWFYNQPTELERFLKTHPSEQKLFDQAFAYWIICKVFQREQNETAYGMLKRELKKFNANLLKVVRSLVNRAVKQIKAFWSHQEKRKAKALKELQKEVFYF